MVYGESALAVPLRRPRAEATVSQAPSGHPVAVELKDFGIRWAGKPRAVPPEVRYADGVRLVLRPEGWLGLGTCPVRFEGDEGWVETGEVGGVMAAPFTGRVSAGFPVLKIA